ncbi:hypothetical protein [Psychrobacter alimentarius]|uniref:hypothetical protein n=1 Tax=Psychrobacter alimentarius TaxID=261164 RepID=UPI0019198260|nr:hypothetical protein [Psychrobacter alimentarius]
MYYEKNKSIESLNENYSYMIVGTTLFSLTLFNLSYNRYEIGIPVLLFGNIIILIISLLGYIYRRGFFKKVVIFTISMTCFTYNILIFAFSLTNINYYVINLIVVTLQVLLILYTLYLSKKIDFIGIKEKDFKSIKMFDDYIEKNIFLNKRLMYTWTILAFSIPITAFINSKLSIAIFILALIIAHIAFLSFMLFNVLLFYYIEKWHPDS